MKRKDAIEKLRQYLSTINFSCNTCAHPIADRVLTFIEEELKMEPPAYRYEDGDIGSCFKNEWEKSDE